MKGPIIKLYLVRESDLQCIILAKWPEDAHDVVNMLHLLLSEPDAGMCA